MSQGATTSSAAIVAAPTTPATWVLAPASAATGVREALALTEKPWNSPAPMFAAPSASSSWFWSTRWPLRPANVRDRTLVSAIEMTAMASAAGQHRRELGERHLRHVEAGQALRQWPDDRHAGAGRQAEYRGRAVAPTAAMRIPGIRGCQRRQTRMTAIDPRPIASAVGFVRPEATPSTKARATSGTPSAWTEKPNSLGSCPTKTVSAIPFSEPIRMGFESSSVRIPSRRTPNAMQHAPEISARPPARSPARAGSTSASGAIVAAMIGASDESGPRTRIRLGPNRAYTKSGRIVAYRPVIGGSPAAWA